MDTETDYNKLVKTFREIGVIFQELEERQLKTEPPIPNAAKYLEAEIAHFHFDAQGDYLGMECHGDGTFVPATHLL